MIIYLDENMPKHLAEGFHILQFPEGLKSKTPIEVRYIPTDFGYSTKDEDWIPEVGKKKACVITQDISINRRTHQLELYKKHNVGMFFLRGTSKKQGMSIWQMVEALAKNWTAITDIMLKEKRPFGYEIKINGRPKRIK